MLGCDCRVTHAWANLDAVAIWPWSGLINSFSVEMCRQVDTFPSGKKKKFLHFKLWFVHVRSVTNICTPFFSVDALEGRWGTSCRIFCINLFFYSLSWQPPEETRHIKIKTAARKNQLLRWSWEKQNWQQLYEEALALEVKLLCHIPSIGLLSGTGGL